MKLYFHELNLEFLRFCFLEFAIWALGVLGVTMFLKPFLTVLFSVLSNYGRAAGAAVSAG